MIFEPILNFITMISSFVGNIVGGMLSMLKMIPEGMIVVEEAIAHMPTGLVGFAMCGITISVVFLLVGR